MAVFSGSAHPELAGAICHHLEVPLLPSRCTRFTNDCLEVALQANCRERDVFLVQPLVPPVQLLRARRPSARPARARPSLQGRDLSNTVVLSPDLGNAKEASRFARVLGGVPVAAAAKERSANDKVTISSIIGDVRGRDVVVLDDEIARGSTIVEVLDKLADQDVASIRVACTHGLFTDGAIERISDRPEVDEIVCTNTVPIPDEHRSAKLTVLSVAPALAEAMRRIHNGESVSVLFEPPV